MAAAAELSLRDCYRVRFLSASLSQINCELMDGSSRLRCHAAQSPCVDWLAGSGAGVGQGRAAGVGPGLLCV